MKVIGRVSKSHLREVREGKATVGLKKKKSEDEKTEAVPGHNLLFEIPKPESSGKLRFSF